MGNKHSQKKHGKGSKASMSASAGVCEIGDDYKMTDIVLGKGHFAEVKKAVRKSDGLEVAVKVIKKKDMAKEKVMQEVHILKEVGDHPAVVQFYDVYMDQKNVFLVMELLQGGELFDRLSMVGPYSEADAAGHVRAIADALRFLHSKGIIHRDLKPENLILVDQTPQSQLRVCDFGLSRIVDVESAQSESDIAKTICGTWAYQAPEVKAMGGHYDMSVDMWSLGVILFVILAAYHPFDVMGQATDDQIVEDARKGNWSFDDPEGDAWATISKPAQDLISKLIVVDATKRLDADEVLKHPWVSGGQAPTKRLGGKKGSTVDLRMKEFQENTKKKFRAAVLSVIAANRFRGDSSPAGDVAKA